MAVRSHKTAYLAAALAISAAGGVWHFTPLTNGHVRPIAVRTGGDAAWPVPGRIDVYATSAELHASFSPDQIQLSRPVDFAREKLVRVGWGAAGCYTDEIKQSETPAPVFGKLAHRARRGGRDVLFYVDSPIRPSLFGTVVYQVFEMRVGSDWFTVPRNARLAYSESGGLMGLDVLMALLMTLTVVLLITSVLTARRRREAAGALQVN